MILFFFIVLFGIGTIAFKDYGVSWDERYQWQSNGYVNYNFIIHGEKAALLSSNDKYHGPAFELILITFEKLLHLSDTRDIFLLRHLMTFLVFYFSALIFYFLGYKLFNSWKLALLGFLFYVLSPHIFSHAFYNSKDTVFLSLFSISVYCMFSFLEKKTYLRAVGFAIITAFTIDVRIIGILIPGFFIYLLFVEWIRDRHSNQTLIFNWKPVTVFLLCLPFLIVLFWPVLWIDPLYHFKKALIENSSFPIDLPVLYFGKIYSPSTLPWHYLFFWMFVSRPVLYSVFFICGVSGLMWKFISTPIRFLREYTKEQTVLFWFFLPLLLVFLFKSPVFDTGRHLYFLHGAFVLISVYGVQQLWLFIKKSKIPAIAFSIIIILSLITVSFKMIRLHPYEHLYFNITQGNDQDKIKNNFEFDYWGLAGREALENLLKIDSSKAIRVCNENLPGELNSYLLKPGDRARIFYTPKIEKADYFLADYRWKKGADYPYKNEVFSKIIGNTKITTIFKLKN